MNDCLIVFFTLFQPIRPTFQYIASRRFDCFVLFLVHFKPVIRYNDM